MGQGILDIGVRADGEDMGMGAGAGAEMDVGGGAAIQGGWIWNDLLHCVVLLKGWSRHAIATKRLGGDRTQVGRPDFRHPGAPEGAKRTAAITKQPVKAGWIDGACTPEV